MRSLGSGLEAGALSCADGEGGAFTTCGAASTGFGLAGGVGFSVMIYVPTTNRVWDLATDIALALDRKGTPIPPQDSLVAAHALQASAAVLTLDKDFSATALAQSGVCHRAL